MSGIGVVKEVTSSEHSWQYCAQVYFTVKNPKDYSYYCHFVVTKDLEICLAVAKKKYQWEYDIAPTITFDGDHIALDIPEDGVHTDNGWEIVPVGKAHIKKAQVDNFSSESTWVPECVLLVKWLQKDKTPGPLEYKMKLKGTGEERNFFRILFNPGDGQQQLFKTESMLLFEQAMKEGHVKVSIIKCLLLGTAGVGKTCLLYLLLDMLPPQLRQSTACIEQATRAICVKYGIGEEGKWQKVDSDRLRDLLAGSVFNSPLSFNKGRDTASTAPVMEETPTSSGLASYTMEDVVNRREDLEEEPGKLQDMTWVYLVDSGGQPQFHELLSAFIRNALVGIFVHKLSERLDDHPHVRYFDKKGKECGTGHRSPLSNRGIFQHCIQTVQSLSYTTEESSDPNLAIVGTFRDEEDLCKGESRNDKNKQLLEILRPIKGKVFYLTGMDKVIFPVNARHPNDEDKDIAKNLRQKIESLKPPPEPLPMKWYGLEVELEKEAEKQERLVFTKDECLQVARRLHFPSDEALDAALVHLDKLNIFLYYPSVLPELVFCSPCVLLDKITELVEESYSLKHGPDPHKMIPGKFLEFCEKGQVTTQLLEGFPKHYTKFFTQAHLLKLFESLLIVSPIDCDTYFMPSLLDVQEQSEINRPSCDCQLVISFQDGCAPLGLFSALVAFLLSDKNKPNPWVISDSPKLHRNHITFSLCRRPGLVDLIDSAAFFEVYLTLECEGLYEDTCRYVSHTVERGLNEAIKARNFQNVHYDKAMVCPCKEGCHTLHPALPCPDNRFWKCTRNAQVGGKLDEYHLVWVKNYTDSDTVTLHKRKFSEGSSDPADTKTSMTDKGSSYRTVSKRRMKSAGEESCEDQAGAKTSTTVALSDRKSSEGSSWKDSTETETSTTGYSTETETSTTGDGSPYHAVTKHREISAGDEASKDQTDTKTVQQAVTLPKLLRFRTASGKLMDQIGTNYWDLGILLLNDAKGAVTKAIVKQYHEDAAKINREILQRWIEGQGMPVEWATLIEVLKDIELTELAREIEKNITHKK